MIKAVFFDFDGVLTPHASSTVAVCNALQQRLPHDRATIWEAYTSVNAHELSLSQLSDHLSTKLSHNVSQELLTHIYSTTQLHDDIMEIARSLRKHYRVGIITDNSAERMNIISDHYSFVYEFDSVTVSAAVGYSKKERGIFDVALQSLAIKPDEAIFIDNTRENLATAQQLGMNTIFFNHGVDSAETLKQKLQLMKIKI